MVEPGHSWNVRQLPYRNDAAIVFRRLARSLPTRSGVLGIATATRAFRHDDGLGWTQTSALRLMPGGVTLPPESGEDAGTVKR
jgi:hypothetical protein